MAKKQDFTALAKNQLKNANTTFLTTEEQKAQLIELDELRSWIPSPTEEEVKQLETNLIVNGCRDALIVWETTHQVIYSDTQTPDQPAYVLVDGHNRHRICKKRGIDFRIQLMSFSDLKAVKDFMIDLQLGRRNLTPQQIQYFRGLRYLNEKAEHGGWGRTDNTSTTSSEKTAEKLAKEYKVSPMTIRRDAQFAEGLQQLAPPLQQAVLSGEVKVSKKQVGQLAKTKFKSPVERLEDIEPPTTVSSEAKPNEHLGQEQTMISNEVIPIGSVETAASVPESTKGELKQILETLLNDLNEGKPFDIQQLQHLSRLIEELTITRI